MPMPSEQELETLYYRIAWGTPGQVLEVFGSTIEFVSWPSDPHGDFCVMRGVVPPGVTVPLHSHDDAEDFLILAGTQEVLTQGEHGLRWAEAHAGDYVRVPGGTLHAHRNVSGQNAVDLIITTSRLGRFFQEVGRPATDAAQPPDPAELARFVATAARYGYTLATPEQNAAVGIQTPEFTGGG